VSVYVDAAIHPFGRMVMCHMMADTSQELVAMADLLGIRRKWIQRAGTPEEHFDICKSKRALAIKAGAIEFGPRELVALMDRKRQQLRGIHGHN
jgi:hypothetical protein